MLIAALDDPATARLLARRLLLPVFPIQGGACDHTAAQIGPGNFGTCASGNYNFTGANVGIGTTSPDGKLHVYDSKHDYKVKYIGIQGGDYRKSVILLHAAYDGVNLANNYAVGRIFGERGSAVATNRKEVVEVSTGAAYQTTTGSIRSVSNDSLKWKLVTCTYNSIKYLAIEVPYRADYLQGGISFEPEFVSWMRFLATS